MGGARSGILSFLCAAFVLSGCFAVKPDSSDDKASVTTDSLSAEPESVATTSGAPNDASSSSVSCTRPGTSVKCDGNVFSARDIEGMTDFTFRACNSYVLSDDEACETRAVSLEFH